MKESAAFFIGDACVHFQAQLVVLDLFFKGDKGKVVVVIADTKLFPFLQAVDFFQKRFVICIIKVNASDLVASVRSGMRVWLHDREKPLADGCFIGGTDLIF